MGTISVSLPSDGTTADVADYNTPITTIVNAINGNLDNDNISESAAIALSKLAQTAWPSWSPTFVNLSGGTLNYAKYIQIGKIVHFRLKYTLGGAGVAGAVTFTTPTSIHGDLNSTSEAIHASVTLQDTGTAAHPGILRWGSSTTISIHPIGSAGNYVNIDNLSSTIPHIWANTDIITVAGTYEAA